MESVEKTIEIDAPVDKVYNEWTRFEQFPEFMEGVQEVRRLDERRLHWVAKIGGKKKEWDSEITEQVPAERIAWRSTGGAPNTGEVKFVPTDRLHTLVVLRMRYEPSGVMENLAGSLGVVSSRIEGDLKRFRDFIEHQPAKNRPNPVEFRGPKIKPRPDYGTSGQSGLP